VPARVLARSGRPGVTRRALLAILRVVVHPVALQSGAITDHGLSLSLPAKSTVVLDLR